jgi:hypothetical protein
MAVFIADSHATSAAVTVVVGVERAGEAGGGGARVRIGELESLHRRSEVGRRIKERFMILMEKIVLCCFSGSATMAAFCGFAVFSCFATLRYAFFRVTGFTSYINCTRLIRFV